MRRSGRGVVANEETVDEWGFRGRSGNSSIGVGLRFEGRINCLRMGRRGSEDDRAA